MKAKGKAKEREPVKGLDPEEWLIEKKRTSNSARERISEGVDRLKKELDDLGIKYIDLGTVRYSSILLSKRKPFDNGDMMDEQDDIVDDDNILPANSIYIPSKRLRILVHPDVIRPISTDAKYAILRITDPCKAQPDYSLEEAVRRIRMMRKSREKPHFNQIIPKDRFHEFENQQDVGPYFGHT